MHGGPDIIFRGFPTKTLEPRLLHKQHILTKPSPKRLLPNCRSRQLTLIQNIKDDIQNITWLRLHKNRKLI